MNEWAHCEHSADAVRSVQATPRVEVGESSLVFSWAQGNRVVDMQELVEGYGTLLAEWGFRVEDVMALIRSRSDAKLGAGLRLFADCGGQVNVTRLGLS